MNQRDLPEVVAELIYEMHEVRSEIKGINGRLDRLEEAVSGMREDMKALPEQIGQATIRALEPFLLRILDHETKVKDHEGRLNQLENPTAS